MALIEQDIERIVGRYALYGEIASGGMATVHFGRLLGPVGFSRTVAIKRLHTQFARDPEFVSMFLDEARLAGRIQHPNVVPTIDVVALEGELFLVMEYVQGETLSRLLRTMRSERVHVSLPVACGLMAGVLHGLHAAHEARSERGAPLNIVHRDISPQNIILGADGVARVLDFGVAKASGRIQSTREGQLKGKLAYMAPEQLRGKSVDRRLDIYGAAVVLWECLVGRRAFSGDNEGAVVTSVLEGAVEPPSTFRPDVPPELDAIVMKGMARDPADRYATAREFAIVLEDITRMASARQIGEWVEKMAGSSLAARAERVSEIESISANLTLASEGSIAPPPPAPAAVVALPSTLPPARLSPPRPEIASAPGVPSPPSNPPAAAGPSAGYLALQARFPNVLRAPRAANFDGEATLLETDGETLEVDTAGLAAAVAMAEADKRASRPDQSTADVDGEETLLQEAEGSEVSRPSSGASGTAAAASAPSKASGDEPDEAHGATDEDAETLDERLAASAARLTPSQISSVSVSRESAPHTPRNSRRTIAAIGALMALALGGAVLYQASMGPNPAVLERFEGTLAFAHGLALPSPPTPTAAPTPAAPDASALPTASANAEAVAPVATARRPVYKPRTNCSPPYTVDSAGIRIPKPECL